MDKSSVGCITQSGKQFIQNLLLFHLSACCNNSFIQFGCSNSLKSVYYVILLNINKLISTKFLWWKWWPIQQSLTQRSVIVDCRAELIFCPTLKPNENQFLLRNKVLTNGIKLNQRRPKIPTKYELNKNVFNCKELLNNILEVLCSGLNSFSSHTNWVKWNTRRSK